MVSYEHKGTQECWRADVILTLQSSIWKRHTRTLTFVLSLFMWQAKAPAGGTHSTLYSLRTCDCGGRERRKGGERGRGEKEAQVETLVF